MREEEEMGFIGITIPIPYLQWEKKRDKKKIWVHSEWVLRSASRGGGFSIVRLNDTQFGFNNEPQPIHFHSGQNNVHEEERDAHGEVKVINDRSDEQFHILHLEYAVVLWYQVAETCRKKKGGRRERYSYCFVVRAIPTWIFPCFEKINKAGYQC